MNPEQKLRIVEAWRARRARRGDDRRRRQRRAGAPPGRHRRGHGHHRDRGQQGSRRHGPRRRRLLHDRPRRRGGAPDLRQHPALRALPPDDELGRGLGHVPRPVRRPARAAPCRPDPVDQPRDRRPARARPRRRAGGARRDAPAAPFHPRIDPRPRPLAARAVGRTPHGLRRPRDPGDCDRGRLALADDGLHDPLAPPARPCPRGALRADEHVRARPPDEPPAGPRGRRNARRPACARLRARRSSRSS